MEENLQTEEGISLLDIVKLLLGKIKLLILVGIIGGFLGGMFAVWRTIDINYYGTTIEFYVNPEKPRETSGEGSQYGVYGAYGRHVMDNMIKLLESESFTEKLLLGGQPLPDKKDFASNAELCAAIDKAQEKIDILNVATDAYTKALSAKTQQYLEFEKLFFKYYPNEDFYSYDYENRYNESVVAAYKTYEKLVVEAETKEKELSLISLSTDIETPINNALTLWRQTYKYKNDLYNTKNSVSFSYLQASEDIEDANNLARSFIYVNISVLGDGNKAFAIDLLERVKVVVPAYVEENMTVPTDYQGTNCQKITTTETIGLTNQGYTTNQAIKYAVLVAAAAVLVVCVIIIIVDRSDKRLRDYEIITKKFNVPVLGVVPTIEALQYDPTKKKAEDKEVK